MPPSPEDETKAIYEVHHRWLVDVLSNGGSLLTPGAPVWTVERLAELEANFLDRPDITKDKKFLDKLHDQLSGVSPEGIQLMAELHVVHFLIVWIGAISAAKKRADLAAILSWMPKPVGVSPEIDVAMSPGLCHPGQWVMTRRDTQLAWLIRFAQAWKGLTSQQQSNTAQDPWKLKAFAEGVVTPQGDAARLALLHLSHPQTFEPIVSTDHKRLIAERFCPDASASGDLDRQLIEARASLTSVYGEGFDWYHEPLVFRWWKSGKAYKGFTKRLAQFRALPGFEEEECTYKLEVASDLVKVRQLVIEQEPGWVELLRHVFRKSTNNLTSYQTHETFLKWVAGSPDEARLALAVLWADDGAPAQRLSEFLALVPQAVLGPVGERVNIGTFLLMADGVTLLPPMMVSAFRRAWKLAGWSRDPDGISAVDFHARALLFLDELILDSSNWPIPLRHRLDAQGAVWALCKYENEPEGWHGEAWVKFVEWRDTAPDEDTPFADPELEVGSDDPDDDVSLIDHLAAAASDLNVDRSLLDELVGLLDDKGQVVLYGPPGTGKTFLSLRLAEAIAEGDNSRVRLIQFHPSTSYEDFFEGLRPRVTDAGQVTYELRSGPLLEIAEAARRDPGHRRHVLIIDEINRANLPKVFGELLFLLEYRTRKIRTLYRPTEDFELPDNLLIIGTMNTADRSVALVDAAMRRRFHFVPFFPHEGAMQGLLRRWLDAKGGRTDVANLLDAVNEELLQLVGDHLLIGPSHFMKTDLSDAALQRIWTYNIFPLIEEQLWGNTDEIKRWRWEAVVKRFAVLLGGIVEADVPTPANQVEVPGGDAG